VHRGQVVGAGFVDRIAQPHPNLAARVVHGQLLSLNVHGEQRSIAADGLSRTAGALGQQISDVLAPRDHLHARDHGFRVPEAQIQPARVPGTDQPVLEAFHGERDRGAGRDGIHGVAIAELVGLGNRLQIVDAAVRAEAGNGLVLWPAVRVADLVAVVDLDLALAAHRTGEAAAPPAEQFFLVRLPTQAIDALE